MTEAIYEMVQFAVRHGVMIKIGATPCCGETIVEIDVAKDYLNSEENIHAEFIIDDEAAFEDYDEIEYTLYEMLEDA